MKRKVEYCTGNLDYHTDDMIKQLQTLDPEITVKEWGCLGNCHRCFRVPFCLIDEYDLIEADTIEHLYTLVLNKLQHPSE
ncbi:DUF1450 domain-containing protein [Sulfoacidibacillus ferrooxidans]|uniref:DUF1450 domain-containing protein n=1 Tax=Sulfoacidibacillus ferrooxidans TaxID=2005001 RepID=A0A9X2AC18_9BACL|nr:DUF1450 domain-containing protein [Sulfoacidibacillus ferrooxidans]MCI0183713.1 hypothetical protein [Sulfoacidibacillus ferrooxidans]